MIQPLKDCFESDNQHIQDIKARTTEGFTYQKTTWAVHKEKRGNQVHCLKQRFQFFLDTAKGGKNETDPKIFYILSPELQNRCINITSCLSSIV